MISIDRYVNGVYVEEANLLENEITITFSVNGDYGLLVVYYYDTPEYTDFSVESVELDESTLQELLELSNELMEEYLTKWE